MKRQRTINSLTTTVHQLLMDAAAALPPEDMMQLIAQLRGLIDRTEKLALERWRGTA